MLSRLPLGVICEQLYGLLAAAARSQLTLRETLAVVDGDYYCPLPLLCTLEGFEFEAQSSIDTT